MKRIRMLYLILAALIVASVFPLLFYAFKTIDINRRNLETNENVLQNSITHSVAEEISIYSDTFHQSLNNLDNVLKASADLRGEDGTSGSGVSAILEQFVSASNHIIYVTVVDEHGRGVQAGNFKADTDPFMMRILDRGFTSSEQGQEYQSDPVMVSQAQTLFPVLLVSRPMVRDNHVRGMIAAVVNLQFLVERLQSSSTNGLEAFVVDRSGHLVLTPNPSTNSIGQDMSSSPIVQMFLSWKGSVKAAETRPFDLKVGNSQVPMVGTYWPVQSLGWGVIAQKKRDDAYRAVDEMISETTFWGVATLLICLAISYALTLRLVHPIRVLTQASRAISRGDFSGRIHLKSRTEIGELAATFNVMSSELELYIQRLKDSADQNRQLFMDCIRMIAAAVDEKDPYTHGHSERVSRYSVLIAKTMELPDDEIDRIRISALLHDIGKIGIEDKILKKPGVLTEEEFAVMKQHPKKGGAIAGRVSQLKDMVPGIELHHEALDGRGYPYGLKGDEIPLMACIIAVADTFDAMTTHRPYQTATEPAVAIEYILSYANKKFDPAVAQALESAYKSGHLKMSRAATTVA